MEGAPLLPSSLPEETEMVWTNFLEKIKNMPLLRLLKPQKEVAKSDTLENSITKCY